MFKNITIGQYLHRDSLVHGLDPRTKILLTMFVVIVLFLIASFWGYLLVFGYTFLIILLAKLPLDKILRGLRPVFFILIFTLLLHLIFTKGGDVIFRLGPLVVEEQGLYTGLFMVTRIVLLVLFTSLLTLTTSPIRLTDGIEYLLKPFRKIGVPAHELAMMMTIALRFIPTLMEEADKIMKAQKARGADFEGGSLIKKAKSLIPLLVPLFISAFRRADELAMAMEARCYRGGESRTRMTELAFHRMDFVFIIGSLIFLAGVSLF
ncbi:MAG: energy-coupling factor transporter transmembrane component T [Halanaerobium sp.]|nr:energy-coupling factor transporter transmembrane component T [Halanaerobium sp.]